MFWLHLVQHGPEVTVSELTKSFRGVLPYEEAINISLPVISGTPGSFAY